MNISHAAVTQWGLTHVDIKPHFTILDAGCGGGQTIKTLSSRVPEGKLYGIDYSEGKHSARFEEAGNLAHPLSAISNTRSPISNIVSNYPYK